MAHPLLKSDTTAYETTENNVENETEVERAAREKEFYNTHQSAMDYENTYRSWFYHADQFNLQHPHPVIKKALDDAHGKTVLELGSSSWFDYLYRQRVQPSQLECINISEMELAKGVQLAKDLHYQANFQLMDAHHMDFADNTFDMVFGGGILHHLDIEKAMPEVLRVLKPGGTLLFYEPLAINPIGNLVRLLTPHRRTDDEQPFGLKEIKRLKSLAPLEMVCQQFLSVPLSMVSKLVFPTYENPLMQACNAVENALQDTFPPFKLFYRRCIFYGKKQQVAAPLEQSH